MGRLINRQLIDPYIQVAATNKYKNAWKQISKSCSRTACVSSASSRDGIIASIKFRSKICDDQKNDDFLCFVAVVTIQLAAQWLHAAHLLDINLMRCVKLFRLQSFVSIMNKDETCLQGAIFLSVVYGTGEGINYYETILKWFSWN